MKQYFRLVCKFILCTLFILFNANIVAFAQAPDVEIASSPNPVGSGARALGMGGAFIAVADDATAASWNPAGLIQLDFPELSAVWAGFRRTEDNTFDKYPSGDGEQSVSELPLNYLSFAFPLNPWGRNMVVSLNHQHLYDFTREWKFPLEWDTGEALVDFQQAGRLTALGLACCVQVNMNLSFGVTLNIWDDGIGKNEWRQRKVISGSGNLGGSDYAERLEETDEYSLKGFNANLGLMWQSMNQKVTLAAVLKTPFSADLTRKHTEASYLRYPDLPEQYHVENPETSSAQDGTMKMPMSYGVGIALRFSDKFTLAADFYRTEWDDFSIEIDGEEPVSITGLPEDESDVDATHQVRIGGEYLCIFGDRYLVPVRLGAFYDPAPAEGSPDDFWGFSGGIGILSDRFFGRLSNGVIKAAVFDFAYQYRFGNDVGKHLIRGMAFSQDVEEHTVYASVIVHF